ncbi:MAG: DALR domain-containing protein, partial [Clostridia bacterium]
AARKETKDPYEIANFYTKIFLKDMEKLNIDKPEIITKATENISQMIDYVKEIIKNGYAYETSKGIYFDISKLDKYPVLSNRKLDDQIAGARVDVDPEKKNPYDFALWIKAPENHIMKWESPWGLSYPGWHLECSTMGRRFLGEEFDIHTGGVDHIPTHHENEIAQSKGATGKIPAHVWMHCEYLQVDGGKMSKSLGNTYTISQLQEKGISPLAFKLFCFTAHYRNKLNFTFEGAYGAQKALERLYDSYVKNVNGADDVEEDVIKEYEEKFLSYINDDMNMPGAMSVVWDIARNTKKSAKFANLLLKFDEVLGLDMKNAEKYLVKFKQNDSENCQRNKINRREKKKMQEQKKTGQNQMK